MSRIAHSLVYAAFALLCASCASPRISERNSASEVGPAIVAIQGALSEAGSERLVESRLGSDQDDPHVRELIAAVRWQANAPLMAGNRLTLLIDGPQTLAAMRRAIAGAQHNIHLETYIFADDDVGREMRDLLIERQREGVEVRVIYDAVGSLTTPGAFFDTMREAGIEVREFRPLDPVHTPLAWKINNRDHRKILVVDGRTAFTGGINISSTYASSSLKRPGPEKGRDESWRDTHIQIDGPVAAQFQSLFLATWTRAGGTVEAHAPEYFPTITAAGSELVAAVATDGDNDNQTSIYATYLAAIRHASQRIWLTNAYFAPNEELRSAMIEAVKRGVDVRLIVPGFTDSGLILYASRSTYKELLHGGVRIYEQPYALLHAKTAVIDTALSMVGSANLDMRSFLHNNEVNAVIVGSGFARQLEQVFQRDLQNTRELNIEEWRKRPLGEKLKEFGSSLFSYWL
ncbi:MAG TPA: cardiolipin synthase [Steroidobacteraceae bacterium]|jgi:cardiolipin synthase